jgi:hypothetical protein
MRLRLGLLLIILCSLGCDLRDYEADMNRTRRRLRQVDEERASLGENIHLPNNSFLEADSLHLRLPRDLSTFPHPRAGTPELLACQYTPAKAEPVPILSMLFVLMRRTQNNPHIVEEQIRTLVEQYSQSPPKVSSGLSPDSFRLRGESSHLLEANAAIQYQRIWMETEEPTNQRADTTKGEVRLRACYDHDVYFREASDFWLVILFKQLDVEKTRKQWQSLDVTTAHVNKLLPPFNDKRNESTIRADRNRCLASLRFGEAAKQRLEYLLLQSASNP